LSILSAIQVHDRNYLRFFAGHRSCAAHRADSGRMI
jgi:hypothetical protein